MLDYLPLILAWALFGFIHSLTASTPFKHRLLQANTWLPRYYRLIYNGFSLLTFLPVLLAYRLAPHKAIVAWQGADLPGLLLIGAGLLLGIIALAGYDLVEFTGFPPRQPSAKSELFRQQGLLRYVRHPLYLAMLIGLLGLCLRDPSWKSLIFSGLAFVYLRIGIYFEEQKLLVVLGHQYRDYQLQVPMLFPFSIKRREY